MNYIFADSGVMNSLRTSKEDIMGTKPIRSAESDVMIGQDTPQRCTERIAAVACLPPCRGLKDLCSARRVQRAALMPEPGNYISQSRAWKKAEVIVASNVPISA